MEEERFWDPVVGEARKGERGEVCVTKEAD